MRGGVFALAGGKGGVGKTTVAANVAVALVKEEYDVAVVDADLGMTNLDLLLDLDVETGVHSVLSEQTDLEEITVHQGERFTIVPGERGIEKNGDADPARLHRIIDPLADTHDIVLVDTGAGINHQNCIAYGRSDAVALVTTPTEMSVANTKETRELVERVDGTIGGLVLTHDQNSADHPDPETVADVLETDLLASIPEYEEFDPVEPRVLHAPSSPAAVEYRRLATALSVYHKTGSTADVQQQFSETRDRERTQRGGTNNPQDHTPETRTENSASADEGTTDTRKNIVSRLVSGTRLTGRR